MDKIEQKLDQVLELASTNAIRISELTALVQSIVKHGATKDELKNLATKDELADMKKNMATKDDIWRLDQKIDGAEERLNTKMDTQKRDIMDHIDGFAGKHIETDTEVTSLRSHARRTDTTLETHDTRITALEEH